MLLLGFEYPGAPDPVQSVQSFLDFDVDSVTDSRGDGLPGIGTVGAKDVDKGRIILEFNCTLRDANYLLRLLEDNLCVCAVA